MTTTIRLKGVTKYYGRSKSAAVEGISLDIKAGEVYGFLGANGAGKSTTIRTIMGFIKASDGEITLLGKFSAGSIEARRRIGYLPGDVVLHKRVTGRALLSYLANLTGHVDKKYVELLIERFEAQIDKRTDELSKGNRQKIGLIQAFMHQPKILILDEPTSGLDPLMQEQFYKTVAEARERGATVFLSSHSFEEVERICDRIGIVRKGKLVYEGTVAQVMETHVPKWRVSLKKVADADTLKKDKKLTVVSVAGKTVVVEPTATISEALGALAKVPIVSMSMYQRELEDEFMSFYQDEPEE